MPICSASACGSCRRLTVDSLCMPWAERIVGKPCAGNLHARFEEGGGGGLSRPSATRLVKSSSFLSGCGQRTNACAAWGASHAAAQASEL